MTSPRRYDSSDTVPIPIEQIRAALASAVDVYVCPTCAGTGMVGEDCAAEMRRDRATDPPTEPHDA